MGLTQRQFSFNNYEAIKRMRAASVLNTFPNKLAQGSITVQTSTKVPLETPLHSPVKVSGLIAFFLAARKFVKQECENWNCQDCNKKQAHVSHHFEEASRLSLPAAVLGERKHRPLAGKK